MTNLSLPRFKSELKKVLPDMVSILVSPSLLRPLIAALGEEKWHIDLSVFMKEVGFSSVWYFKGVCLDISGEFYSVQPLSI